MELKATLTQRLQAIDISIPKNGLAKLTLYLQELIRWNQRFKFVKADPEELVYYHLPDILAGLDHLKRIATQGMILDFGSGAGLPGLPLAILMEKNQFVLCERKTKEQIFLKNIVLRLGLANVEVIADLKSVEPKNTDGIPSPQVIICRAVTSLYRLYLNLKHYLKNKSILLAYKGRLTKIEEELAELRQNNPDLQIEIIPLRTGLKKERHLVKISQG